MKYFLGLIIGLLPAIAFNSPAIAQSTQSCANYWTNPQTGRQECLTEPIRREVDSASQRMYSYICNGVIPKT